MMIDSPTMPVHILVVDDDPEICEFVGLVLMQEGYQVTVAASGEEALAKALQQSPQVIVSDVILPGMDGFALCRKLRENPSTGTIPILMLTRKTEIAGKMEQLGIGPNDYLPKPFLPEDLRSQVQGLLNRVRPFAQLAQSGNSATADYLTK